MDHKERLRESIKDSRKDSKSGAWHSRAYHKYFEGYSEITVPGRNGKGSKIERVYTGNYYRLNLSQLKRILIRVLFGVLLLSAVALFINAAIQPLAINTLWYVVLPEAASLLFMSWMTIALFQSIFAKADLTIAEYRSTSQGLKKAALGAAISLGVVALSVVIYWLIHLSDAAFPLLLCALQFLAGGALVFGMRQIECKVEYLVIPNPNIPPENSFEIQ